jgi:predicted transcriptional regulator of viral defense system
MKFAELLHIVGSEPVFETGLLLAGEVSPADIRRQLTRWKNAGKVYQLRRGLYALAPPYQKAVPHPFLVANRLVRGSYVSLQSALAYFGLIPEYVPVTMSVTTGRPGKWDTVLGAFTYRHVQVPFFTGYQRIDLVSNQAAFIATPEKVFLDLVYLQEAGDAPEYLQELRLQNLTGLDMDVLRNLASELGKPKLQRAAAWVGELAEREAAEFEIL